MKKNQVFEIWIQTEDIDKHILKPHIKIISSVTHYCIDALMTLLKAQAKIYY